jgi:hypothetical protein
MEDRLQSSSAVLVLFLLFPSSSHPDGSLSRFGSGFFFSRRYLRHRSRLLSARTARTS